MKDYRAATTNSAAVTPDGAQSVPYAKFLTEKHAKNEAYCFILSSGLLRPFAKFSAHYRPDDPHADCLATLIAKMQ